MSVEKRLDNYVGDIVGGLIREAAFLQEKCASLELTVKEQAKEIARLKEPPANDCERLSQGGYGTPA